MSDDVISLEEARAKGKGPPGKAPRLPLVWFDDIEASMETNDFVEGVLGRGGLSVLYGESNSGKTFFATDLGLHVAMGRTWHGREVDLGTVVYVAAEGGFGVRNRVAAFRHEYGLHQNIPFAIIPDSINMLEPNADSVLLIERIKQAAQHTGLPVSLVIIDTLSRAMAGGNENDSQDMGAVVMNADAIRKQTGAHVMFVHHSGKDTTKGARGHSMLRAATDSELEVTRDQEAKLSRVRCTKQRDMEADFDLTFRLHVVELGANGRGKPVTSCVVYQAEVGVTQRAVTLTPQQRLAVQQLENVVIENGKRRDNVTALPPVPTVTLEEWRDALRRADVLDDDNAVTARQQWKRIKEGLQGKEIIGIYDGFVWLKPTGVTPRDSP